MPFIDPDGPPPNRIVILDFGRYAGIMDRDGHIICRWPVEKVPRDTTRNIVKVGPRRKRKEVCMK